MDETVTFDEKRLGAISKSLTSVLFSAFPHIIHNANYAVEDEEDGKSIVIHIVSPTGDAWRNLHIWVCNGEPSLEFGPSHIHEDADTEGYGRIVETVRNIFSDRLVFAAEVGGLNPEYAFWLDLSKPDALADELTDTYSSGHLSIKSWTGLADREVRLSDISI
jgi:hypothetical protein